MWRDALTNVVYEGLIYHDHDQNVWELLKRIQRCPNGNPAGNACATVITVKNNVEEDAVN